MGLFLAAFANVFLRSVQQLNVQHDKKIWVPIVSLFMAAAEMYVIGKNVINGWHLATVITTGAGSAAGCIAAIELHSRLRGGR